MYCEKCGLEVANLLIHEKWHRDLAETLQALVNAIPGLFIPDRLKDNGVL
jgi:hypothetical protein